MSKTKAHIRYRLADKTIVPGVTTVLGILNKPALVPWANKLGLQGVDVSRYVDDKADIGTLAHAFVTDHLTGVKTDTSDYSQNQISQAENSVLSFFSWEKEHPIEKAIFVEKPLVSEVRRYGGTQDIYAIIGGKHELIDLKTGKGIYPEHVYQVAALRVLLLEHGYPVDTCRIINIPRTEDEEFLDKVCSEHELYAGWRIFRACLDIYTIKKEAA